MQAWCLNPLLLRKVQTWALKSNGCFPSVQADSSCTTFVRYEDAIRYSEVPTKWANIKSAQRAIEKLVRVYEQVMLPCGVGCMLSESQCTLVLFKGGMSADMSRQTHTMIM